MKKHVCNASVNVFFHVVVPLLLSLIHISHVVCYLKYLGTQIQIGIVQISTETSLICTMVNRVFAKM